MSFVRRVPIPVSALALGLAALGNVLLPYSPVLRAVCGALAAAVALLVLARLVLDFPGARTELANSAMLAVFPAFFMALMLLAVYLKPYAAVPAKVLWIAALACQLLVSAAFLVRFVVRLKRAQVLPSWFLVFVGFVVASVTSPAFEAQAAGRILLLAGLVGYGVALALIVNRLATGGALPDPALPTLAIFAAPPSLCLVGYLAVTPEKQSAVVLALLAVAGLSLAYVLVFLPKILRLRFYPSCAALTFPLVISAAALKQSNAFLAATPGGSFIPAIAITLMDALAAAIVLYVLVRYAVFLVAPGRDAAH